MGDLRVSVGAIGLLGLATLGMTACEAPIPDRQLTTELQQAQAANAQRSQLSQPSQDWNLSIQGSIPRAKSIDWSQLQALAKTRIRTQEPHHFSTKATVEFQGISIKSLLDQAQLSPQLPDTTEITFVAFDGFRTTVPLGDLRRYPILLALRRNGKLLELSEGGPLYLVFPSLDFPGLKPTYTSINWVFYVTNIVVGLEAAQLRIGDKSMSSSQTFSADRLDRLPQVTLDRPIGYRLHWPRGNVLLQGVRIQDVLAAAGYPTDKTVIVRGKAPTTRDQPLRLSPALLGQCDIIVAHRWGLGRRPIPARMGGPLTLAFGADCPPKLLNDRSWMTFVEALEVEP
jgi:hypothetical protein